MCEEGKSKGGLKWGGKRHNKEINYVTRKRNADRIEVRKKEEARKSLFRDKKTRKRIGL